MIYKYLTILSLAVTAAAFGTSASAASSVDKNGGFYATPVQKGAPRDLPGEQLIPGVNLAVDAIDGIARPLVVDPIQVAGASVAAGLGEPAPAKPGASHHAAHHKGHKAHHHKKHK